MKRLTLLLVVFAIQSSTSAEAQYAAAGNSPPYAQPSMMPYAGTLSDPTEGNASLSFAEAIEDHASAQPIVPARVLGRVNRLSGGHEFDWLRPTFSQNVAVTIAQPGGTQALAFVHPFETTSRVWAAMENSRCNGLRARYWYIDVDAETHVNFATASASPLSLTIEGAGGNLRRTAVANPGDAMTSDHHLEMRTIDLEGTHRIQFQCSRTSALAFAGLRYAKIHQRTHAVATDGSGDLTELVCQDLYVEGFGPTVGLEIARPVAACNAFLCRFSYYADTRGSLLVTSQDQDIVLVTGGGTFLAEDAHSQDDVMPIAELSCGLQWTAQPWGRGIWTIRTGYRAESWFAAGGPVDSDSNLGLHGMLLSVSAAW